MQYLRAQHVSVPSLLTPPRHAQERETGEYTWGRRQAACRQWVGREKVAGRRAAGKGTAKREGSGSKYSNGPCPAGGRGLVPPGEARVSARGVIHQVCPPPEILPAAVPAMRRRCRQRAQPFSCRPFAHVRPSHAAWHKTVVPTPQKMAQNCHQFTPRRPNVHAMVVV